MQIYRYDEIDPVIHDRLINWGIWCVEKRSPSHCKSIEYRYKPERIADNEDRRAEQIRRSPNTHDAAVIEAIVSGWTFPQHAKRILKCHYVQRMPKPVCCRKLGIRFSEFGLLLARATHMLGVRIETFA